MLMILTSLLSLQRDSPIRKCTAISQQLGIDGDDDTIYFKIMHKFGDQTRYLVFVDMRNKALKASAPLPSPMDRDYRTRPIAKIHFGPK